MLGDDFGENANVKTTYITPKNVLIVVSAWEVLFHICSLITRKIIDTYRNSLLVRDDIIEEKKRNLMKYGPSYAVAGIHAFILSIRGCMHFIQLLPVLPKFQMQQIHVSSILSHVEINADEYRAISSAQTAVEISNLIFFGWLTYDILHVLFYFPRIGGLDTVFHHLTFMVASFINGYYTIMLFPFGWLIMGELSTVFLNIRWFLIQTGRGVTPLMKYCNYTFAGLFFLTRVVLYGWGLVHMALNRNDLLDVPAPKPLVLLVVGLLVLGYILNLIWMKSIYKIATKKLPQSRPFIPVPKVEDKKDKIDEKKD